MSKALDATRDEAAAAAHELAGLRAQIRAARTALERVRHALADAEARLGASHAARLVEANEQLVFAALRAQDDVAASAQALDELSRSAHLDSLTRLPDRVLLLDRFALAMAVAKRHGSRLALLFVDLDAFKPINDSLGHAVGDEVLRVVSRCLSASVREGDTVSRHGGDEFLVLLNEVSQPRDAARVAEKVLAALAVPCVVGNRTLRLSASIGISLYPDDGEDAAALIDRADAAMYRAKHLGPGGFAFYANVPTERAA